MSARGDEVVENVFDDLLLPFEQVSVRIHREHRRGVPESPGDREDVGPSKDPETGGCVSQRVRLMLACNSDLHEELNLVRFITIERPSA